MAPERHLGPPLFHRLLIGLYRLPGETSAGGGEKATLRVLSPRVPRRECNKNEGFGGGRKPEPLTDPGRPISLCPQFPGNNFPPASSTAGNKTVSRSGRIMCHRRRVIHWSRERRWQRSAENTLNTVLRVGEDTGAFPPLGQPSISQDAPVTRLPSHFNVPPLPGC